MRKLSGQLRPLSFRCLYTYRTDDNRQKLTAERGRHCRSRSGDSKQPLYEAQCVTPSVRFLFAPQSYTCPFRSTPTSHTHTFPSHFLPSTLLILSPDKTIHSDTGVPHSPFSSFHQRNYLGKRASNGATVHYRACN